MNSNTLRELFTFFASSDVVTLEFKEGDASLYLSRAASEAAKAPAAPVKKEKAEAALAPAAAAPSEAPANARVVFNSPMVGTFYAASAPGASPLVKVGDTVSPGTPVCIIEAMKLLNEVEIDRAGVITEVLVKDGDLVEFGQPLFAISESAC